MMISLDTQKDFWWKFKLVHSLESLEWVALISGLVWLPFDPSFSLYFLKKIVIGRELYREFVLVQKRENHIAQYIKVFSCLMPLLKIRLMEN